MIKNLIFSVSLLLLASLASAARPLVGVWNKDGVPASEIRADGTGQIGPDAVKWEADARTITLTYANGKREKMAYFLDKNTLTVIMDGESETYTRSATKVTGTKSASTKAPAAAAGKDTLSKLLLSSSWCYFSYSKISGSSHQERVNFRQNGSWDSGARAESYSSGTGGTVSGQSDSSSGGRWQVQGGTLLMSSGDGELEDTGLTVSRNSNGYPILKTGKKEYSSCN